MKINYIFLIIGVILSAISKAYQFKLKNPSVGNIIVLPAASFLCLGALFSINKFLSFYNNPQTKLLAILMAVLVCGAVLAFQLMMITLIAKKSLFGLFFLIPLLICAAGIIFILFNYNNY